MEGITLLIAVVALIVAILAYQRTGGTAELKRHIEAGSSSPELRKKIDTLGTMADLLCKMQIFRLQIAKSLRSPFSSLPQALNLT